MLLTLGLFSFVLGFALLILSVLFMAIDIFWGFSDIIFKVAIAMIIIPIFVGLLIAAFSVLISLLGLTLLF